MTHPTPTKPNELYVGYARLNDGPLSGSTLGYTYDIPQVSSAYIYDTNVSTA